MSLNQDEQTSDERERLVADFLVAHPDFLVRHPEVLAEIDIPHPTGDAVSLIERQVRTLREQNRRLRGQLDSLVAIARENDATANRLHRLTLALIEARSFEEVLNTLQDELRNLFQADAVEMKLFSAEELASHAAEAGPAMFADFIQAERPTLGELPPSQLEYLFGSQATETGSVALIPLHAPPLVGVLAIGSHDPQRFHAGKSVDFLKRLADVVSASLSAVSSPGI
ncbi:MAG: DUF484 family protein [Gammaproteobacteria bacterium]|nr:MAG: DUF484 family protein [Gammaproteobacteria bacterium]